MFHVVVREVGDDGAVRRVGDSEADGQRHGVETVDHPLAELRLARELGVQMERLLVHGQIAEALIVALAYRPALLVADGLALGELLEVQTGHGREDAVPLLSDGGRHRRRLTCVRVELPAMARRSILFAPGDDPAKLRKAPTSDADVVVFDLEDAVVPDAKAAARETVRAALSDVLPADCEVCVRVNSVDGEAADDVAALADGPHPDSLMLPKTRTGEDVRSLATLAAEVGIDCPILALVESAAGVLHAEEIAAADPTDALLFGAEDLAGDIGATRTTEGNEVEHARQHVVLAARAAGVTPVDTHFPNFTDHDGLRREAERARQLGYDGKLAIHPAQATVINEVFTPDAERIEWATRILSARDEADGGVFVVDGEMIDAPQIRQAERVLDRAGVDWS